jgi:dihydrofolate reductase
VDRPTAPHRSNPAPLHNQMTHESGLEKVEWGKWNNARLMKENVAENIQKLKQQPGRDMVLFGGANIAQSFMHLGLIDALFLFFGDETTRLQ